MNRHAKIVVMSLLFSMTEGVHAKKIILEPESWSFPEVVEHARKINTNNIEGKPFNRFGLVYTSEEVSSLKLSALSAQDLQKYADIVTHAYPDAVAKHLPSQCGALPLDKINETAVAGIAYVSINAIQKNTRNKAIKCLAELQSRFAEIDR
ncbi:hypothetical protein [Microbulbifer sp. THAF38]|uniref:hypothetical protein n=1 Tax=Microbulbifer sp. THAF38 TaxID=2587856 RepID=UPI0012685057|nr:hypothetical protein [Microbulbifer sp. THAF38]QFT53077.1 hypothetical protein FIU95_00585 [Microbulbifer sp. THAF38]